MNHENVVLGQLGRTALTSDEDGRVEDFMTEGPTTTRPHMPREKVLEGLRDQARTTAIVTTADGRLVGAVRRE